MSQSRWQKIVGRSMLLRAMYAFLQQRLTSVGRTCFLLLVLFGLGGAASLNIPLYMPWGFFFVLLLSAVISSSMAVPRAKRFSVKRLEMPNGTAGRTLSYDVQVTNHTNQPIHDIEVAEWMLPAQLDYATPPGLERVEGIGPDQRKRVRLQLHCHKRGAYALRTVGVLSAFPLGMWRGLQRHRLPVSMLVYPAFQRLEAFAVPEGRQYQPGGILLSSEIGESSEFMHTREYREGDNPRHIHWASFARRGEPVVKVFQEEYFVRLALLLDSEAEDATTLGAFEAAISTAASIADVLSRQDYIIDLFAAGASLHHFQAGRSLAHLEHILEILACLEASGHTDWEALSAALAPKVGQFTAIVMILLDWDDARAALAKRLQVLGLAVRVVVVREATTTIPLPAGQGDAYVQLKPAESGAQLAAMAKPQRQA